MKIEEHYALTTDEEKMSGKCHCHYAQMYLISLYLNTFIDYFVHTSVIIVSSSVLVPADYFEGNTLHLTSQGCPPPSSCLMNKNPQLTSMRDRSRAPHARQVVIQVESFPLWEKSLCPRLPPTPLPASQS